MMTKTGKLFLSISSEALKKQKILFALKHSLIYYQLRQFHYHLTKYFILLHRIYESLSTKTR